MKWFDSFLDWTARISATRANSRASLFLDATTALALLAAAAWQRNLRIVPAFCVVVAGILLFSLVEYCFHRWLFHDSRSLFVMEDGHRKHHLNPQGDDTLPFYLPPSILLCLAGLFALAMPAGYALLLSGVIGSGYAVYGLSHFAMHVRRFRHPLIRQWAAHHHIHHHHPDKNFGVTSPLWDIVMGTRYVSKSARIPSR